MKGSCGVCGAYGGLESFVHGADAREFVSRLRELPGDLVAPAIDYLALFRPRKQSLRWPRAIALLAELQDAIKAGSVRRHGRSWPASADTWRSAFSTIADRAAAGKLDLPLGGTREPHAYLFEIVAGQADKDEAKEERAREERARSRSATTTQPTPADPDAENRAFVRHLTRLGAVVPEPLRHLVADEGARNDE